MSHADNKTHGGKGIGASMKNPHIELVKKLLDNPESVSADELERVAYAAAAAAAAVGAAYTAHATNVAYAAYAAYAYAAVADAAAAADVKYLVEKYEELTK